MELNIKIIVDADGITCSATIDDGIDAYSDPLLNAMAVGAVEIAKASLLARRWGLNVGNLSSPPIVTTGEDTEEEAFGKVNLPVQHGTQQRRR